MARAIRIHSLGEEIDRCLQPMIMNLLAPRASGSPSDRSCRQLRFVNGAWPQRYFQQGCHDCRLGATEDHNPALCGYSTALC